VKPIWILLKHETVRKERGKGWKRKGVSGEGVEGEGMDIAWRDI